MKIDNTQKYTLIAAAGASFLTPFVGSAINLAIPAIGITFNASTLLLSWVVTSYLLASVALLVPFGRLADIMGRKKVFVSGLLLFAISSFIGAWAWSIYALIIFRIIQGIGSAMIFGTGTAMLTSAFPPQQRGRVLGINAALVYIGLSLGPVLGGVLTHNWGWNSIFLLCGILSVGVIFITVFKLKGDWTGTPEEPFDWQGSIFYIIGLTMFLYGLSSLHAHPAFWLIVLCGLALLLVFIRHQLKIDYPLLPLRLLSQNRVFAFSNLAALINYCATFAISFLLSLYLQSILSMDSQTAGFILLSQPVVMALISPFAGRLSDHINPRIVSSWGMIMSTIGLFLFAFISVNTPINLIIGNLIFLGFGFALFASPNTNAVMGSVEKQFYGMASSTLGTMRLAGQTISMVLVTLILGKYVGAIELAAAPADLLMIGIRLSFAVFTVICLLGVIATRQREAKGVGVRHPN